MQGGHDWRCALRILSAAFLFGAAGNCFGGDVIGIQGLGDLPGGSISSVARDVSLDGTTVVGHSISHTGDEAFRWRSGTGMVGLGGSSSRAFAVNADGSFAAGLNTTGWRACRWLANGLLQHLGDMPGGGEDSVATAMSADGSVIVGWGESANGTEAFRWSAATGMVGLGDLPGAYFNSGAIGISADASVIVGNGVGEGGALHGFRWTESAGMVELDDLPGGFNECHVYGVSPDGSITVGLGSGESEAEAVYWTASGEIVPLGTMPGGTWTRAMDASLNGEVIVGTGRLPGRQGAFIWDAVRGLRNLETALTTEFGIDLGGRTLDTAYGISADGRVIVGSGFNSEGRSEAWIVTIPEPATIIMLAVVGVSMLRRRC